MAAQEQEPQDSPVLAGVEVEVLVLSVLLELEPLEEMAATERLQLFLGFRLLTLAVAGEQLTTILELTRLVLVVLVEVAQAVRAHLLLPLLLELLTQAVVVAGVGVALPLAQDKQAVQVS
jgi:hypothetical protein